MQENIYTPSTEGIGIGGGGGGGGRAVCKTKRIKEMYMELQEELGGLRKKPFRGEVWIFYEAANIIIKYNYVSLLTVPYLRFNQMNVI